MAEENKETEIENTEELDGCECTIAEADATPDEDLPAAVGGVE